MYVFVCICETDLLITARFRFRFCMNGATAIHTVRSSSCLQFYSLFVRCLCKVSLQFRRQSLIVFQYLFHTRQIAWTSNITSIWATPDAKIVYRNIFFLTIRCRPCLSAYTFHHHYTHLLNVSMFTARLLIRLPIFHQSCRSALIALLLLEGNVEPNPGPQMINFSLLNAADLR